MTRTETLTKFCQLAAKVANSQFGQVGATADCFCGENPPHRPNHFCFEEKVFTFIKEAVEEKLAKSTNKNISAEMHEL